MSSKVYLTSYQTVEKLLNVSSQLGLKDLAVRFGCLEAQPLAETLLKKYLEKFYLAHNIKAIHISRTFQLELHGASVLSSQFNECSIKPVEKYHFPLNPDLPLSFLCSYKARVEEKYTAAQKASLDLTRTLYHVAALYSACK